MTVCRSCSERSVDMKAKTEVAVAQEEGDTVDNELRRAQAKVVLTCRPLCAAVDALPAASS